MIRSLIVTLAWLSFSTHAAVKYQITTHDTDPKQGTIKADTSDIGAFQLSKPRTTSSSELPDIQCLSNNGQSTIVSFDSPISCRQLSWTVNFEAKTSNEFEPAQQVNTYEPNEGWYFLSEWNSLPTIQGQDIEVCDPDNICSAMPNSDQPPLFVVWGMPYEQMNIGASTVVVKSNALPLLKSNRSWFQNLTQQLDYLSTIFNDKQPHQWQLIYFSKDKSQRNVSGATGYNTLLSNVLTDKGAFAKDSMFHLAKVTAHESVHFMGSRSLPVWAEEGLAEYYAIKSLQFTDLNNKPSPVKNWEKASKEFQHLGNVGLIEAGKKVSIENDMQYYPLFYVKGPAFWQTLDEQLQANQSSLDTLVPLLQTGNDFNLPDVFVNQVISVIGNDKWQEITLAYL
ncbi:hypothetical protein [Vibrio barjaei]|uniref:hypothetical protein n=1 Tax=Vibrio barjaei TaxID=1676683 RepID=UPI0007BB9C40|nr:hypothetical protein [Vibrio barjaei]MCY9874271.1 hypothetical protein [Vibrio barjaei]OIN28932.1 hypothetical protein AWH66_2006805 [Vibrio barjaei]